MGAITAGTATTRAGRGIVRAISTKDVTLVPFSLVMSNSYATNGDTGFRAAAGLPTSMGTIIFTHLRPQNGYTFVHDDTNDKLLAYVSGGTQVTNATDLSGIGTVRGIAYIAAS